MERIFPDSEGTVRERAPGPIDVETAVFDHVVEPVAYTCLKFMLFRQGTSLVHSRHGRVRARPGTLVIVCGGTLCGGIPETSVTVSTAYVSLDYLLDQLTWRLHGMLLDRHEAEEIAARAFRHNMWDIALAPEVASKMAVLLDRVEQIQKTGGGFYAIESRFVALLDLLLPLLPYTDVPEGPVRSLAGNGVGGRFPPLRREIVDVGEAVQADLARKWSLADLAGIAHISPRHLTRAFNESYGLPPLQYVAALRAKEMARLLREKPEWSVETVGRRVGWEGRAHARAAFTRLLGIGPDEYRRRTRGLDLATPGPDLDETAPRSLVTGAPLLLLLVGRQANPPGPDGQSRQRPQALGYHYPCLTVWFSLDSSAHLMAESPDPGALAVGWEERDVMTPSRQDQQAAREARLDELHEKLTHAVDQLVSGEDWKRALAFAANFRSRSFNNTLLIWAQHAAAFEAGRVPEPMPSYVAGYKQWQGLGRQVQKGQPGYQILAPVTGRFATSTPQDAASWRRLSKFEKPRPGETVRSKMIGVKPAYVWDVSQTSGDPIPEAPRPRLLEGEAPAGLWEGLASLVEAEGFAVLRVPHEGMIHGANGLTDYPAHTAAVRVNMDPAAQVKTLAHELAHVRLHGPDNEDATHHRGIGEVEADSVALMVGAAHGMDTTGYTIPYVAGWAATVEGKTPVEVVQATGERVRKTAAAILDALPTVQVGGGDPPGLSRQSTVADRAGGRRPVSVEPERVVRTVAPVVRGL